VKLFPKQLKAEFKLPRNKPELMAHFIEFAGADRLYRQRLKDQLANRYQQ